MAERIVIRLDDRVHDFNGEKQSFQRFRFITVFPTLEVAGDMQSLQKILEANQSTQVHMIEFKSDSKAIVSLPKNYKRVVPFSREEIIKSLKELLNDHEFKFSEIKPEPAPK